jgi:hypothetical protein
MISLRLPAPPAADLTAGLCDARHNRRRGLRDPRDRNRTLFAF